MENLKLGETCKFKELENIVQNDDSLDYYEYGSELIGQFIYQIFDENVTWTFILDGSTANDYIMKLVYIG
jgi:hypothetical protein